MGARTRIRSFHAGVDVAFFVTDCAACGVFFAIPEALEERRRSDGEGFFCPNGHRMVFTVTEADQLRRHNEALKEQLDSARQIARNNSAWAEREKRRAAAARGQVTKLRNRVAKGLCPQAGCKRSFTSLHDHVRTEHPELLDAIEGEAS